MHIRKSAEPKEWTEYKNIPGVQFSGIPALQESLYREQGYLCAYCERRIPVRDKMSTEDHRIEHWHCRDKYPDEVFSYGNLLMCCPGQIGGGESHCDVRKGNDIIEWSPLKKECTDSIRYSLNGTILSSNASWDKELNEKLNLNRRRGNSPWIAPAPLTKYLSTTEHEERQVTDSMHLCPQPLYL